MMTFRRKSEYHKHNDRAAPESKVITTFQKKQISLFPDDDVRILLLDSAPSVPRSIGLRDEKRKPMPTRGGCV